MARDTAAMLSVYGLESFGQIGPQPGQAGPRRLDDHRGRGQGTLPRGERAALLA